MTNGYKCSVILGQLTIMGSAPPWAAPAFRFRVTAEYRRAGQSCMLAAGVEARGDHVVPGRAADVDPWPQNSDSGLEQASPSLCARV